MKRVASREVVGQQRQQDQAGQRRRQQALAADDEAKDPPVAVRARSHVVSLAALCHFGTAVQSV